VQDGDETADIVDVDEAMFRSVGRCDQHLVELLQAVIGAGGGDPGEIACARMPRGPAAMLYSLTSPNTKPRLAVKLNRPVVAKTKNRITIV
jgi:hypothetical protein